MRCGKAIRSRSSINCGIIAPLPRRLCGYHESVFYWMKSLSLPIRTVNPLNNRRHWRVVSARSKRERATTYLLAGSHWTVHGWPKLPATVLLTRIAPRAMDTDGLAASFKAVRDGIAERLGIDDGSDKVKWEYAQRRGKPKEYAVEIEIK